MPLDAQQLSAEYGTLTSEQKAFLAAEVHWLNTARAKQLTPEGEWYIWLILSGRGFGKTHTGSQWVRRKAFLMPGSIGHVIARTHADLRGTMFKGPAGILSAIPSELVKNFNESILELTLTNGSKIIGFSAESPDALRGPQCHYAWPDELASWQYLQEAWDNLVFSTRLKYQRHDGSLIQPQVLITTTPRPLKFLSDIRKRGAPQVRVVTGASYENRANLAETFIAELEKYEGTQIGRQEIHGEILDSTESAIIKRSWLQIWPNSAVLPYFEYIVVSMDTAFTERTFDKKTFTADPTACTVWGVFVHERRYHIMLLECWEEHMGLPELISKTKKEMKMIYGRKKDIIFKPLIGSEMEFEQVKHPDLLVIEDKGSGISLRQMLATEGILSYPYNPGRADKLARLHAVSHIFKAGLVWLPESKKPGHEGQPRDWVEPFLEQLCQFAGEGTVPHDDYVDSCSQALRVIADNFLNNGITTQLPLPGEKLRGPVQYPNPTGASAAEIDSLDYAAPERAGNPYSM